MDIKNQDKVDVMISHASEERSVALYLKKVIEEAFLDRYNVFASSSKESMQYGAEWEVEIRKALQQCDVLIVLCSPLSITRPWVNIEAGAVWIRRKPLLTISYNGMTKAQLPRPLGSFEGANLDEEDFTRNLFSALTKYLGVAKAPKVNDNEFISGFMKAISEISHEETEENNEEPGELSSVESATKAIPSDDIEIDILCRLSEDKLSSAAKTSHGLAIYFGLKEQRIQYHLDNLVRRELIDCTLGMMDPSIYYLTNKGRQFLVHNNLL